MSAKPLKDASASSSDLLGNGEMLVMRTIERPADPLGELVGPQKPVELHDPPFPVYPLGLDGVQPRTLLRKKATHDPHPTAAVFDLPVVFSEPSPDLLGDVPARVVPDEHQHFLARRLELFGAPRKEPRRYTAHGPAVDEPQPHLAADLGQVEPVAGDRFGIGVVLGDRLLDHTMGLSPSEKLLRAGKATLLHQHSSSKPMAHSGFPSATSINRSLAKLAFFLS